MGTQPKKLNNLGPAAFHCIGQTQAWTISLLSHIPYPKQTSFDLMDPSSQIINLIRNFSSRKWKITCLNLTDKNVDDKVCLSFHCHTLVMLLSFKGMLNMASSLAFAEGVSLRWTWPLPGLGQGLWKPWTIGFHHLQKLPHPSAPTKNQQIEEILVSEWSLWEPQFFCWFFAGFSSARPLQPLLLEGDTTQKTEQPGACSFSLHWPNASLDYQLIIPDPLPKTNIFWFDGPIIPGNQMNQIFSSHKWKIACLNLTYFVIYVFVCNIQTCYFPFTERKVSD